MWQLFLERFIPVMEDGTSSLDARDGVGRRQAARSTSGDPVAAGIGGDAAVLPLA